MAATKAKDQLVEEMRATRAKNNQNWMDLVLLVQEKAPDTATRIMEDIHKIDLAINHACAQFKVGADNDLVIYQLEELRRNNNENWINLLRLAFLADEARAVEIMQRIAECDATVLGITKRLKEG